MAKKLLTSSVTSKELLEWQKTDAFLSFASKHNGIEHCSLGINGYGSFEVYVSGNLVLQTKDAEEAITKYNEGF